MNNSDFWASIHQIIAEGFTPEGLQKLNYYAEQFISGRLVYQRFSPREQHGCAAGGEANVIASILAGAEDRADSDAPQNVSEFEGPERGARSFEGKSFSGKFLMETGIDANLSGQFASRVIRMKRR
jgi:hypothetical protein